MPLKKIKILHGYRLRVTMKKENTVSCKHFGIFDQARADKYIANKERKGWKLQW